MTQPTTRLSTSSDNDERFRRASIISSLPLLANAPSIQKLSLKHLSTIDSKRFMRVLDNTVTRVLIVSSFPRIISNVKEYSLLIGRNATVLFEKYGPLSRTYDEQCSMLKQPPRYTDREATEQHRQSLVSFDEGFSVNSDFPQTTGKVKPNIAARLFELTRMILRELLNNPLAISAMIRHREKWDIEPSPSCRRLAIQLVHLRSLTRNDLLTTPKARARRDDFLERLRRRDLEQRRMIDELTGQYEVLQKTQKTQLLERMKRVRALQDKIRGVQQKTQDSLSEMKQKYDSEKRLASQKHYEAMRELENILKAAKEQLAQLTQRNYENERKIRMEKWKIEDTIAAELTKMDTHLFEMQAEYDQLASEDEKEKAICDELTKKLEPLKLRADAVMEEKRLEAERQEAEMAERENLIKAATTIQSLWRSWKARKMVRAERKKNRNQRKK